MMIKPRDSQQMKPILGTDLHDTLCHQDATAQNGTDEREHPGPCCAPVQTVVVLAFLPGRSHWELLIPPGTLSDLCSNLHEFLRWQSWDTPHALK